MKRIFVIISFVFSILLLSSAAFGQSGPPPPPGGGHGSGDDQDPGNSVPIGNELYIFLGLGAAYGAKKLYVMKTENHEDEPLPYL